MANYVRGCCDVCVRERDRSMYHLEPVDLYVTHGEEVSHLEAHASSGLSSHTTE